MLNHIKGNQNDLRYGLVTTLKAVKTRLWKGWICTQEGAKGGILLCLKSKSKRERSQTPYGYIFYDTTT